MRITDLLTKDTMILELKAETKEAVIEELVNKLDETGKLYDKKKLKKRLPLLSLQINKSKWSGLKESMSFKCLLLKRYETRSN